MKWNKKKTDYLYTCNLIAGTTSFRLYAKPTIGIMDNGAPKKMLGLAPPETAAGEEAELEIALQMSLQESKPASCSNPFTPDSPEVSEEFNCTKHAFRGDQTMISNENGGGLSERDSKISAVRRAPAEGSKEMRSSVTTETSSSKNDTGAISRREKEMCKAAPRLKNPPSSPGVYREDSNSFLHNPHRFDANASEEKRAAMMYNTGTSTPGAQWASQPAVNVGPLAEVAVVPTAHPEEPRGFRENQSKDSFYKKWLFIGIALVLVIVAVAVIIGVTVMQEDDSNETPDMAATTTDAPSMTPREELVLSLLEKHPQTLQAVLEEKESPQAQAFYWITKDSDLDNLSDEHIQQRFAMATFYFATGGNGWANEEGSLWLDYEAHECFWIGEGSTCDEWNASMTRQQHYDIQHIMLSNNGLSGFLPPEIFWLTSLKSLDLFENNIQGKIPSELGLLTKLTKMDLSGNALTGVIPADLGGMESLEELYLEHNSLTGGIPSSLFHTPLLDLRLKGNTMDGRLNQTVCSIPGFTIDCGSGICGCSECQC